MSSSSSVPRLEEKIRRQRQIIKRKNEEIDRLKAALRALLVQTGDDPASSDIESPGSDDNEIQDGRDAEDEEEGEGDEDSLPEAVFDGELTYYCSSCACEVVEGQCAALQCGLMHRWDDDEMVTDTIGTDNEAIHVDRSLVPRGNTPLLDIDERVNAPREYSPRRLQEYFELRRRGASHLMCETFNLEYTYEGGMYAWADAELYEEFSGNEMQLGDHWKIHLGRRVSLDADDLDGSAFIEGLLEDALLFPYRDPLSRRFYETWETLEETPGIWVTRMKVHRDDRDEDEVDIEHWVDDDPLDREDDDGYDTEEAMLDAVDVHLENPPVNNGPICSNEYSVSDDEFEDDLHEQEDLGIVIHPSYPDRVWTDEHDVVEIDELDEDGDQELEAVVEDASQDSDEDGVMSSCDSDFDEEEILSGDEGLIEAALRLF